MENAMIPYADMEKMATVMGKTGMFGKSPDQLLALMLIAQSEGIHPARAAQEYDVIQGRPALKSQSALARFQEAGGKIEWKERGDTKAEAVFSHPQSSPVTISWDMAKASRMGLAGKDNWKKQPGIMLQWRVVAEGVRICYPACLNRMYLVEEVQDFEPMRNVTPTDAALELDAARMSDPVDSSGKYSPPSDPGEPAKRGDGIATEMLDMKKTLADIIATEYEGVRIFTKEDAADLNAAWHPGGRNLMSSENDRALLAGIVSAWEQKRDAILSAHQELDGETLPLF